MCAPRAVLGPVKRGVTDTPRREKSCEARVSHHPLACARYFTPYTCAGPDYLFTGAPQGSPRSLSADALLPMPLGATGRAEVARGRK